MSWRVVHTDERGRRHCMVVDDCNSAQAAEAAEALWGPARYLATMRLQGRMGMPAPRPRREQPATRRGH